MRARVFISIISLVIVMLYVYFGYYVDRNNFYIDYFFVLFALSYALYSYNKHINEKIFWILNIGFRLIMLFSIPLLSDDFYRFIWDGILSSNGISPFAHLPSDALDLNIRGLDQNLFQLLNSPEYYTVYPPFCQWIFALAADWSGENIHLAVFLMKLPIVVADHLSIFFLQKLLDYYKKPKKWVWLYAFNPLVIIEFSGNAHLEAYLICFLLAALWFFMSKRYVHAGAFFALSVGAKLIPLMLLPLFVSKLRGKSFWIFGLSSLIVLALLFMPFIIHPDYALNLFQSVQLYFQTFEFNASIFYLFREIGYLITGYNTIAIIGKISLLLTLLLLLFFTWKNFRSKGLSLAFQILLTFTLYQLLASIVHPWYILSLLPFAILLNYRFVELWTFLIPLSYLGYSSAGYKENVWVVLTEYVLVISLLIWELKMKPLKQ